MLQTPITKSLAAIFCAGALTLSPIAVSTVSAAEAPVAAEKNPPGDIPDSQVFITYNAPTGFSMKVPEGWARTDTANGATFSDKYNLINVSAATAGKPPTVAGVEANEAKTLKASGHAVRIASIKKEKLDGGPGIVISYSDNSAPNTVTNKKIRLEHNRYLIFKNGTLVTLDMGAPYGADNVDQWALMSKSVAIK